MRALDAAAAAAAAANRIAAISAEHRRRALIGNRCFDDGPDDADSDGGDIWQGGDDGFSDGDDCALPASKADGSADVAADDEPLSTDDTNPEYNSHLATTHRQGDHGIW